MLSVHAYVFYIILRSHMNLSDGFISMPFSYIPVTCVCLQFDFVVYCVAVPFNQLLNSYQ